MSLQPINGETDKAVDLDTGDIYVWDADLKEYVMEEKENVSVETPENDSESSDIALAVSDLEVQVNDLANDVTALQDEVSLLSSYDASNDYNLGTTNQAIFAGLANKVPFGQHYVFWRDGQYSYKFAYGDLSLDGIVFSGSGAVTICDYSYTGSSYNNYYTYTVSTDNSFSLSAGQMLVYSDLGNYPEIGERGLLIYGKVTAVLLSGAVLWYLFERLRCSCFGRSRNH